MSPGSRLYLDDILEAIRRIQTYAGTHSFDEFTTDYLVQDAVCRNLANIGEAVKRLPTDLTSQQPQIEWRKIAGLRDILVHEYAGIDLGIVWDVVETKLPPLRAAAEALRRSLD